MEWTALSKHLSKLGGGLAIAIAVYALLRNTSLYGFTGSDVEGLNALIQLIGSTYAVMFAFVIFVIWGQFTSVETAAMRECNSLHDLLRFGQYLSADSSRGIRRGLSEYTQRVADSEWHALAGRRKDQQTEKAFTGLVNAVLRTAPASPAEEAIQQRLIDIARKAGEHHDERIAQSLTRVPPTLLALVRTMAAVLLLLILVYPFHQWLAGLAALVLVAVVLFLANLVMTDTDNPFEGVCNVSPQPFLDLMLG